MNALELIEVRRDRHKHTKDELQWFAKAAGSGEIPDYQLAAWLMAAYLNPLSDDETAWLTMGMAESGERVDLSGLPKPWVDKHSTGGVGDKTTLVVLPMLAACGLTMVKMSGRGLGITGGTVDKLESIPGFRMDLSPDELRAQAQRIGIAISGQTPNLAPADKVLYAIRDAIGAVESMQLITSSILSKKLAGGAELVSLDVKCGSGGFMKDLDSALALAKLLTSTAQRCGLKTTIAVTDMSQPLGQAVGNAIEVREALEVLKGKPGRFRDLCVHLVGHTLAACGKGGPSEAKEILSSGLALAKAREWFEAQGADPQVIDDPSLLRLAPLTMEFVAESSGWIAQIDAGTVGLAVIEMGGGRHAKEDSIDPSVGIEFFAEVGDQVSKGQTLFKVYARDRANADASVASVKSGISISQTAIAPPHLILAEM